MLQPPIPTTDETNVLEKFKNRCAELGATYLIESESGSYKIVVQHVDSTKITASSPDSIEDALDFALMFI